MASKQSKHQENPIGESTLWTTKRFFSTVDSVLREEKQKIGEEKQKTGQNIIKDSIPSDLKPLILELRQTDSNYERVEPLLVKLMKSCYKAKDVVLGISDYLLTNQDILCSLSSLARNTLIGQTISYKGTSFLTLLYEWFRLLTEASSLLAIKVADAGFVGNVLHCLDVLVSTAQYNEMFGLLLTVLLGFIQNLAVESACWPHFEQTRFVDILTLHAKTGDGAIRFMSLYVLALLVEIIPLDERSILMFEEEPIKEYVDILIAAVSTSDLQATKVYGSLVIPADDILRLLKQIWSVESNRNKITKFISLLINPIEICLQKGDEMQQTAAVDLLWTLVSDSNLLSQVQAGHVCVDVQLLEQLAESSSRYATDECVQVMALCVLYKFRPESLKKILEVVKGTYRFKRYAECIDLCHQILPAKVEPNSLNEVTTIYLLYRGKAFCRLYQQNQKHFQEASSTLSKKEFYVQQSDIYKKAGEAVNSLGSLLDVNPSFLDEEALFCLDVSMIDIACQVNNLKEYSRCLLCLNRAKLHKSHMCPASILDAFASGLEKTKNRRIYNLTFFEEGKMISPHGVTRWLFCGKCENTLSRDGETHFIPKLFRHIYNTEKPHQLENATVISYDQWLYRFVIGLLFRGLINEAFSSFLNSDVIYSTFVQLRQLICFEGALSDLPRIPDIYLIVSPSVPTVSAGFIGHIYHAPFLFALTNKDLQTGSSITPRTCQFFLARIGIMNFLLLFDNSLKDLLPPEAKISVSHGEFVIPPEAERNSFIPDGINQILNDLAIIAQKNLLESTVTTVKDLKLSDDAIPPPCQETATYMTHDAISSDVTKLGETILTGQPINYPQKLNFLPRGFKIEHLNGLVTLPDGHQILFHGDFEIEVDKNEIFHITLFLAAGNESSSGVFSLQKPYVIFHRYQPAGLEVTFGFFVDPNNLSVISFLPDTNPKVMRNQIGNQLRIKTYTNTLLPQLMKLRGLRSYFTVVHRAVLQKHTITYDHVCGKLCWYCKLRCNTCLSQASPDLSSKTQEGRTQRFCSKTCQNVYLSSVAKDDIILDVFDSQFNHLLLLSFDTTLPLSTGGFSRVDISVYMSKDSESDVFPNKSLYVVYHHSTIVEQHFLEYFIFYDCSFSHMLHYYKSKEYPEMKYAIDFAKQLIAEKLKELDTTLETLVDFTLTCD